jgi:hypothetical protein
MAVFTLWNASTKFRNHNAIRRKIKPLYGSCHQRAIVVLLLSSLARERGEGFGEDHALPCLFYSEVQRG